MQPQTTIYLQLPQLNLLTCSTLSLKSTKNFLNLFLKEVKEIFVISFNSTRNELRSRAPLKDNLAFAVEPWFSWVPWCDPWIIVDVSWLPAPKSVWLPNEWVVSPIGVFATCLRVLQSYWSKCWRFFPTDVDLPVAWLPVVAALWFGFRCIPVWKMKNRREKGWVNKIVSE